MVVGIAEYGQVLSKVRIVNAPSGGVHEPDALTTFLMGQDARQSSGVR
jgi:hypothetical protein